MDSKNALENAISWAGSVNKLAHHLGITHSNVSQWRANQHVPPSQRIAIERLTDGQIKAIDFDSPTP